jgi:hypothetical protein
MIFARISLLLLKKECSSGKASVIVVRVHAISTVMTSPRYPSPSETGPIWGEVNQVYNFAHYHATEFRAFTRHSVSRRNSERRRIEDLSVILYKEFGTNKSRRIAGEGERGR